MGSLQCLNPECFQDQPERQHAFVQKSYKAQLASKAEEPIGDKASENLKTLYALIAQIQPPNLLVYDACISYLPQLLKETKN